MADQCRLALDDFEKWTNSLQGLRQNGMTQNGVSARCLEARSRQPC